MIFARYFAACMAIIFFPLPAWALCVVNGTGVTFSFTVEATETGARQGRLHGPDDTLCLPVSDRGVVAAFEFADSLQGCSRLAKGGDQLLTFAGFDRYTWASHLEGNPPAHD